jgi:hypothetical protein
MNEEIEYKAMILKVPLDLNKQLRMKRLELEYLNMNDLIVDILEDYFKDLENDLK